MIKLLCKAMSSLVSTLYGVLAGAIVSRIWNSLARQDSASDGAGTRRARRGGVRAAACQSSGFTATEAAGGHSARDGAPPLTDVRPGDEGQLPGEAA